MISEVCISSGEVVAYLSERNGYVRANKVCVGAPMGGGIKKKRETRTCSDVGLTSP